VVAISKAQKTLRTISLDDCEIYVNAEPCAMCSLAIRETRIRRVVYGLSSPFMGGLTKWNVLADEEISSAIPEVFAPPPKIVSGYMAEEAQQALVEWNPIIARIITARGLFGTAPRVIAKAVRAGPMRANLQNRLFSFLRRNVFDYFGRR
jgi:tRNA(adenine34) deaminase